MPDHIYTQTPANKDASALEHQAQSAASQNQAYSVSSPYWTPIALYYLEREVEWARG